MLMLKWLNVTKIFNPGILLIGGIDINCPMSCYGVVADRGMIFPLNKLRRFSAKSAMNAATSLGERSAFWFGNAVLNIEVSVAPSAIALQCILSDLYSSAMASVNAQIAAFVALYTDSPGNFKLP